MTEDMEIIQTIIDKNDLRKYFGMIPHIADDELGLHAGRLYMHYVRVCGANGGKCDEAEKTTAKSCGMGKASMLEARQELVDKGFVRIAREGTPNVPGQKGLACVVEICDVWLKNFLAFDKGERAKTLKSALVQIEQGGNPKGLNQTPSTDKGSNQTPSDGLKGFNQTPQGVQPDPKEEERISTLKNIDTHLSAHEEIEEKTGVSDAPKAVHLNTSNSMAEQYLNKKKPSQPAGGISADESEKQKPLSDEMQLSGLIALLTDKVGGITKPIRGILESPFLSLDKTTGKEVIHECAVDRYENDTDFRVYAVEQAAYWKKVAKDKGQATRSIVRTLAYRLRNVEDEPHGYFAWRKLAQSTGQVAKPVERIGYLPPLPSE